MLSRRTPPIATEAIRDPGFPIYWLPARWPGADGHATHAVHASQEAILIMELIKLGKKGQLTIPRSILQGLGLTDESALLVDTTDDGAIMLRPAAVYPIEIYSDERIEAFEQENQVPDAILERVKRHLPPG